MNHSQALAPMQQAAAMQAVYQFLHDQGFVSSAEMLEEESGIPCDADSLEDSPSTLLTALSHYENQRAMAFQVQKPDEEQQNVQAWIQSLRSSTELHAKSEYRRLQTHMANVICCKFQPKEGSTLYAAGSFDKSIAICSVEANSVLRRVTASGPVLSMHFNPAVPSLLLATCMNGGHTVINVDHDEGQEVVQSRIDHKKYVVCGKWSPSGDYYATGSHDGSVHVYGADSFSSASSPSWSLLGTIDYPSNVESLEWVDESHLYVSVREDNYLHHVSVSSAGALTEIGKFNTNAYGDDHVSFNVLDMAISPNGGKAILLATDHHRVILMQTGSSHQIRNFYNLQNDGYSTPRLAWSPCGKYAYVTCQDRSVAVLDIASGQSVHRLKGHDINVRDVSVHANNNWVLTCSFDKTSRVWHTDDDTNSSE